MNSFDNEFIVKRLISGNDVISRIISDNHVLEIILKVAEECVEKLTAGGKIFFMGNGGSAADSQHLATELVSRYLSEGAAIPAIALTTDTSAITAIGNDYSFDNIFSRQLEALCSKSDVVFGISTSGNSRNVIKGLHTANYIGCSTVALTGSGGGEISNIADNSIIVPSDEVPYIQQAHIAVGHIICEIIERVFR